MYPELFSHGLWYILPPQENEPFGLGKEMIQIYVSIAKNFLKDYSIPKYQESLAPFMPL